MFPDAPADASTDRELVLLRTPLGLPWSGRARYAAAMYFYQRGDLTAEAVEAYRICSRLDAEDPSRLLALAGLTREELALVRPPPQTVRSLR